MRPFGSHRAISGARPIRRSPGLGSRPPLISAARAGTPRRKGPGTNNARVAFGGSCARCSSGFVNGRLGSGLTQIRTLERSCARSAPELESRVCERGRGCRKAVLMGANSRGGVDEELAGSFSVFGETRRSLGRVTT